MNQSVIKNPIIITLVYAIIMYIKLNIVIGEIFGNSESKE